MIFLPFRQPSFARCAPALPRNGKELLKQPLNPLLEGGFNLLGRILPPVLTVLSCSQSGWDKGTTATLQLHQCPLLPSDRCHAVKCRASRIGLQSLFIFFQHPYFAAISPSIARIRTTLRSVLTSIGLTQIKKFSKRGR